MVTTEHNKFLEAIITLARGLIQSGAEMWRVEDSLTRILRAYQFVESEVYASSSLIVVTIKTSDGEYFTQSARVGQLGNNFALMEELNGLSRRICTVQLSPEEILEKVDNILLKGTSDIYMLTGHILAVVGFTLFFGGTLLDALAASLIGVLVFLVKKIPVVKKINYLFFVLIMNIITCSLAIFSVKIGFANNTAMVIIGTVMLFIPALSLMNGVRDMFNRDIISGLFRIIEGSLIAVSIAAGTGVSILMFGGGLV